VTTQMASVVTTVVTMRERCVEVLFFKITLVWIEAQCSDFYIPPPMLIGMMIYPLDRLFCCSYDNDSISPLNEAGDASPGSGFGLEVAGGVVGAPQLPPRAL